MAKNTGSDINTEVWVYAWKKIEDGKLKVWAKNTNNPDEKPRYCTWPWINLWNKVSDLLEKDINWESEINELLVWWDWVDSLASRLEKQLSDKYGIWKMWEELNNVASDSSMFEEAKPAKVSTNLVIKDSIRISRDGWKISLKAAPLSSSEKMKIETSLKNLGDFRKLWEEITAPFRWAFTRAAEIIDKDPVMNISSDLSNMNTQIKEVYSTIITNDWKIMRTMKKIPLFGSVISAIDNQVDKASFDLASASWKLEKIFEGYDKAETSLNASIDLRKGYIENLTENESKTAGYVTYLEAKLEEARQTFLGLTDDEEKRKYKMFIDNLDYYVANLISLVSNLYMTRRRMEMQQDSAYKLSLGMNVWRPIFETLIEAWMVETSWMQSIEAWAKALEGMWKLADDLSTMLANKTIESNKKSAQMMSKPLMNPEVFVTNVNNLIQNFNEMEAQKDELARIRTESVAKIKDAVWKLKEMNVMTEAEQQQFQKHLSVSVQ